MTTLSFHTIVPSDCTITLPAEFRGEPVNIVVAKKPAPPKRSTMREFIEKYSGILNDCNIESVEAMKEDRNNRILEKPPAPVNGIVGLRGILKGYTIEELENARDEYLTDKYIHD